MPISRKTFVFNFFPTKAEEEAEIAQNTQHRVTRSLVEIRDPMSNIGTIMDPANPWPIRRVLTDKEVSSGEITLSNEKMLDHVLRFWRLEAANSLVQGNKCLVLLTDYTEENSRKTFPDSYIKNGGNNECFLFGLNGVFRARAVNVGDEIGLRWDIRPSTFGFGFKLLRRSSANK